MKGGTKMEYSYRLWPEYCFGRRTGRSRVLRSCGGWILFDQGGIFMKILLTGFDLLGGESVNPAYEAVKLLPDEIGGAQIIKL